MTILIKGMKMPQKEGDYDARLHVNRDGTALFYLYKECGGYAAKELPPHGRLKDENDVMKSAEELRKSPWYNDEPSHAMRKDGFEMAIDMAVKDAPTIIEAEAEKGGEEK